MKNKKLIPITICPVAVVLVGILGMSKFFETAWQQPEQTDNNLSVEIIDDVENIFDYPYVIDNGETIDWDNKYMTTPPEDAISWQEAANIAGETLKYMYGYTGHQTIQAQMCYYDRPAEPTDSSFPGVRNYYYHFDIYNEDNSLKKGEAFVMIEPFTGQPLLFQLIDKVNNNDVEWPDNFDMKMVTEDQKLLSTVSAVLDYLNKTDIERIDLFPIGLKGELYNRSDIIKAYKLKILLADKTEVEIWVNIAAETDYELIAYQDRTLLNEEKYFIE